MNIPNKIEIAGLIYTVKLVNPESAELNYGTLNGSQSKQTCEIFLNELLNGQHLNQSFLHEITHAILDALSISDRETMLDERFVESFSQILHQVTKQI